MKIEFSDHAKERLKQRRISQKKVIQTIISSSKTISSFRSRNLRRKRFSSKMLEVITKNEDKKVIVVTAYYLKE